MNARWPAKIRAGTATGRLMLDPQMQNTIYQFEHKTGVVEKTDKDPRQPADALSIATQSLKGLSRCQLSPY